MFFGLFSKCVWHTVNSAVCEFSVSLSNVRLWQKSKENLENIPQLKWSESEVDIQAWTTEKRNNGISILPSLVQLEALELAKN